MDRNVFLKKCEMMSNVKGRETVPDEVKVVLNGISYYPYAYQLGYLFGKPTHTAVLYDKNFNSITYCELAKVEEYGK